MSFNFEQFTDLALNCTSKAEFDLLITSESAVRSEFAESSSKYSKYSFIPHDNADGQYDSISICFCSECGKTVLDETEPCENCFRDSEENDDNF